MTDKLFKLLELNDHLLKRGNNPSCHLDYDILDMHSMTPGTKVGRLGWLVISDELPEHNSMAPECVFWAS